MNIAPTIAIAKHIKVIKFTNVFVNSKALRSPDSSLNLLYIGIKLVAIAEPITENKTIGMLFAVEYAAAYICVP
ncbi:hypothetical protein SDC9_144292 [bioreactor metagenome]|uniref:Uncharacterized protein n=1 Tax=bioreactor metagenome TaxID=1076179 RepID=A0A645E6G0_9ZZZZ